MARVLYDHLGTDIAMQSAGITLVKGDLRGLVRAIHLSRAVRRNIRQNLFFAFAYNAIGIPLAAGALYPLTGTLLSPVLAGADWQSGPTLKLARERPPRRGRAATPTSEEKTDHSSRDSPKFRDASQIA